MSGVEEVENGGDGDGLGWESWDDDYGVAGGESCR